MNDQITINHPEDGSKVTRLALQRDIFPLMDVSITRRVNDKFVGGVVFNDYTGVSIRMHTAGVTGRWINRDMLWMAFDYPFSQLNVTKIFACVASDNHHTQNFVQHIGFRFEVRVDDVYPDADMMVFGMYRKDCRWLQHARRARNG